MTKFLVWGLLSPLFFLGTGCKEDPSERQDTTGTFAAAKAEDSSDENEAFGLTAQDCSNVDRINRITISPNGSLFINDPLVINSNRAKTGVWSFGFLLREIMELPVPGNEPAKLKAEQDAVIQFLDQFTTQTPVNSFVAPPRALARQTLLATWGKTTGSDNVQYLTFDKAPFKLVGITNRLDISKKRREHITAGEGRFVFGFTGATGIQRMTLILEYNLPVDAASPTARTASQWVMEWYRLKRHLLDTNASKAGVQPAQELGSLNLANPEQYLAALQALTDKFTLRNARKAFDSAETWVPISQIRTNEFLTELRPNGTISAPWELREIKRFRTYGVKTLQLVQVKDNPDQSFSKGEKGFDAFIEQRVQCANPNDPNSCSYQTAGGQLPPLFGPEKQPLLAASAPVDFRWFPNSRNVKQRFVALNTCSGCHEFETKTSFVHVNEVTGDPSAFMVTDIQRRLINFKALVCLAATNNSQLNLATEGTEDPIFSSSFTH